MAKKDLNAGSGTRRRPPAATPEARMNQVTSAAVDLAEKQILEGTASSQVISHFLKLATEKSRYETEILEKQRDLIVAKTEAIKANARNEELYENAIKAMRSYSGQEVVDDD